MKPPGSVGAGFANPSAPSPPRRAVSATDRLFLFLLALLWPTAGLCADAPEVTGIRFGTHGTTTRIVVNFDRRMEPAVAVRSHPPRLVLDLPEVRFRVRPDPLGRPRGLATSHRYGRLEPGRSRIVFDFRDPFRIARQFLLPPSPTSRWWRFVLDIEPEAPSSPPVIANVPMARAVPLPIPRPETGPLGGPAEVALASSSLPPAESPLSSAAPAVATAPPPAAPAERAEAVASQPTPAPRPDAAAPPPPVSTQPVIVLDPGHGGVDPGTVGLNGQLEKNVTLSMARTLARVLRDSGRYAVYLTRDDDRFIPLRERIAIARRLGADLLVSLHADSIDDRGVRGASVYTLSEQASDAEAERLARKENRVDVLAGVDLSVQDEVVAGILIDLARRDTNNKSIIFAETLIEEIDDVAELLRRSRRYAGFAVLKSPDTPSVLLELGYLSNPSDAARLSDPRYRERLARSIARAIDRYFDDLRPPL